MMGGLMVMTCASEGRLILGAWGALGRAGADPDGTGREEEDGFVVLLLQFGDDAEVEPRVGIIGFVFQRHPKGVDGLRILTLAGVRRADLEICVGKIGLHRDGPLVRADRFGGMALRRIDSAEIIPDLGIVRCAAGINR